MQLIFLILFFTLLPVCGGEIALSFDDAPRPSTRQFSGPERTRLLLAALKQAQVEQVAFFVTTSHLDRDEGHARLATYTQAGHVIANHSHAHLNVRSVGAEVFSADLRQAHDLLKDLPGFQPWFRYPFLNQGNTLEDQLAVKKTLSELNYSHGYVTVDNYDFYLDTLLQRALQQGKKVDMEALKQVYIETLWRCIQFYDNLAKATLQRSPKHVLLLHENDLAALFIGDLVAFLRDKGWRIISPSEAYSDPIAKVEPAKVCNQGLVACLAREAGYKGFTADDSEDEAYLEALVAERKVFN